MLTPKYWQTDHFISKILTPIGWVYGLATKIRLQTRKGYQAKIPVICIGNITAGGVGKTPVSIAIAKMLQSKGMNPFFISRGYGGKLNGVLVDLKTMTAKDVGDEPIMLATIAPTVVASDRGYAAQIAEKNGADILIMDDGFQNPTLKKDISFLVFNGEMGILNGKIIPAGPMRESLKSGLKRADGVIIIGDDKTNLSLQITKPIFEAQIKESQTDEPQRVIAFAGIGYPQKFYNSLMKCGFTIEKAYDFPDHHFYQKEELKTLIKKAQKRKLPIYTTLKDYVKIPDKYKEHFNVLHIDAVFDDAEGLWNFIERKIK